MLWVLLQADLSLSVKKCDRLASELQEVSQDNEKLSAQLKEARQEAVQVVSAVAKITHSPKCMC